MSSVDELRVKMEEKLKAIPVPKLSPQELSRCLDRNRQQHEENLEITKNILADRRKEAVQDGDKKKYFHTIAIERCENAGFNQWEKVRNLEKQADIIQHSFPEQDWKIFETFSEFKDPNYWNKAKENGYTDVEIAQYYRDVFGIDPKRVVAFLNLLKIKKEIQELKTTL
jgi:hypothetical protein